jgi:hypothetical protein
MKNIPSPSFLKRGIELPFGKGERGGFIINLNSILRC